MRQAQSRSLQTLRKAAAVCRDCQLWANATQTVFGEGDAHAKVMLVGEQPGDKEDLEGHPFVGRAGQLLDRALEEAGVNRKEVYVTNAVKHLRPSIRRPSCGRPIRRRARKALRTSWRTSR